MSQKRNEVLIEWTEGSCKSGTNRVNVKHILLDAEDITVGAFVTARLNSRKYRGEVKDLLEWSAPQKARRKKRVGSTESSKVPGASTGEASMMTKEAGTKVKKTRTSAEQSETKTKAGTKATKTKASAKKAGVSEEKKVSAHIPIRIRVYFIDRYTESLRVKFVIIKNRMFYFFYRRC